MGSDWRRSRRAPRTVFWLVRALCRPGDRCDRGRNYWREGSHESWSRGLGHISGRSGRRYRETFRRAHYDCDLSDERAVTVITQPFYPSSRGKVEGSRGVTFKAFITGSLDCARDDDWYGKTLSSREICLIFRGQLPSFVLQSYLMQQSERAEQDLRVIRTS